MSALVAFVSCRQIISAGSVCSHSTNPFLMAALMPFTLYEINQSKEALKIDDKGRDLQSEMQLRSIVVLRRRLLRCLNEVKPSINCDFLSFFAN